MNIRTQQNTSQDNKIAVWKNGDWCFESVTEEAMREYGKDESFVILDCTMFNYDYNGIPIIPAQIIEDMS